MKLCQWVEREGVGSLSRLARETGLAYTTVFEASHGTRTVRYETAKLISRATGGEVSVEDLLEPDADDSDEEEHVRDSLPPSAA